MDSLPKNPELAVIGPADPPPIAAAPNPKMITIK